MAWEEEEAEGFGSNIHGTGADPGYGSLGADGGRMRTIGVRRTVRGKCRLPDSACAFAFTRQAPGIYADPDAFHR